MEQIFTTQFWRDQFAVVASAPWTIIPLLLIAGFIGWKWKGINDDGEIRELRAKADAAAERLELAREKYEVVVGKLNELRDQIEEERHALLSANYRDLEYLNWQIRSKLTDLSTSTDNLGETLLRLTQLHEPSGRSTSGSG
jgi:hypothetical protein